MVDRTIGMRLDELLSQVDSLSSPQLYTLIVGLTVVISVLLLGSANTDDLKIQEETNKKKKAGGVFQKGGPEPKWHIFKWFNYAIALSFAYSVGDFYLHSATYEDSLWLFLLGWSVFLCYFFGFFGVSIVYEMLGVATEEEQE
jgi:hypothetical protein